MTHPYILMELGRIRSRELLEQAARDRLAASAITRTGPRELRLRSVWRALATGWNRIRPIGRLVPARET
jgi:hypothetical protein